MFNLKSELPLICVNARGLRDLTKRKILFLFSYFCHGSSRSAGVAILLKNFQGQISSSKMDKNGHWLFLTVCSDNLILILLNIYGYNNLNENKLLLEEITLNLDHLKSFYSTNNVVIGGDVQDEFYDKWPSKHNSCYPNKIFNNFCNEQNLVDVWHHLNPNCIKFSWFGSNSKARLDHWLMTNELLTNEINSDISAAPLTDHSLISL
uniref:Endonuclease/exonuclease/phosphatase domain-containing protein n=1 Tax=Xiphophorus couchianus TaxID=32473 RepID=A0A3B5MDF0_9TELE